MNEAIERLKQDNGLRKAMVQHGFVRAQELNNEDIVRKWRILLEEFIPRAWLRWRNEPGSREQFFQARALNATRLEMERVIVESYAPWLRNRPFDLDEVKSETRLYLKEARRRLNKEWERYRSQSKRGRSK
jgi:superfamily II RNA helicase